MVLISRMSSWTKLDRSVENHFAAIPLQMKMPAEIFQENIMWNHASDWEGCKEYLNGNETETILPQIVNVIRLYDVQKKRNTKPILNRPI